MLASFEENITVTCATCGESWLTSQATFNAAGYAAGVACTPCQMAWYRAKRIR